jgi:lipopolysaccharide export system protein LptA
MYQLIKFLFLLIFLQAGFISYAQINTQPPSDTTREFEIIRGPSMRAIKIDSVTTLQTIAGGAVVKQGTTIFHSDSLVINPVTHVLEAFGNIEINQADTVHTYSQYLKYLGVEKIAYLKKKVKLSDKKGTLFTEDLDYNLETGIGNFQNGGKVIEGKNVITSIEGTYYADTKDVYFKKNVKLDGPKNHVRADSLLYNMQTRQSTFISNTNIKNAEVEINTTQGTYDLVTGNAFFTSRSTVKDSSGRIYTANNMALENKSGNAQLEGEAVIIDSAGGYIILANQIFLNKINNSFLATRKPVLIIKQKHDSTYIAADTIFSGFSTFVKNENIPLQEKNAINVSLPENEKIAHIQITDSTQKNLPSLPLEKSDSSKVADSISVKQKPDSIKQKPDNNFSNKLEKVIKGPPKKEKIVPEKRDSLLIDSSRNKVISEVSDTVSMIKKPQIDSAHSSIKNAGNDSAAIKNKIDSLENNSVKKDLNKQSRDSTKSDSIRYFLAFHHVRVFNDSLQSVADSLFLSSRDSVFRLYYDPVVWSGNSQITGDTIYLFTKNKQPERLYVFENGMIVNKTKEGFYNQMAGKTINGYFIDGKIDYMRVKGSQSESIYYLQDDDSAYIGMNRASGDVIDLYFKNEELKKVLFINDIKGTMYPMNEIPTDQMELKNFKWLDSRRPKNKIELFE